MATFTEYYSTNYGTMYVSQDNTEEHDCVYTPLPKLEAALARQPKKPKPKQTNRTVVSLRDPDYPTYDIVDESKGYLPSESLQVSVTPPPLPKKNNGTKKLWIWQCTKRCKIITCVVCSVLVVAIGVTVTVLGLKGKFYILLYNYIYCC